MKKIIIGLFQRRLVTMPMMVTMSDGCHGNQ